MAIIFSIFGMQKGGFGGFEKDTSSKNHVMVEAWN